MTDSADEIRSLVRERFARIAQAPATESRFPVGEKSARAMGYDAAELDALPPGCVARFAGVGCVISLGPIKAGSRVLDVGSGSGLDAFLAGRRVGPSGRVIGIDMTVEMVRAAQSYRQGLGMDQVEFHHQAAEQIPLDSCAVDLVISNGAINLCPDKRQVLAEIHRVLKPGGHIYLADIFLEAAVDQELVQKAGTWSD